MDVHESNIDRLLRARARIDGELRQFESVVSILFTDLVGSTAYFDRYGDTAGVAMLHRHVDLGTKVAQAYHGRVIKTIGDSIMAEFSEPVNAVRAAVDLQRQLLALNLTLPERERLQLRVGINHGSAIRYGTDVYGDAVNVAARIVKHTGPAQILVSRSVRNAMGSDSDIRCNILGRISIKGKAEQEELFEIVWTEPLAYARLRAGVTGGSFSPGLPASSPAKGNARSPQMDVTAGKQGGRRASKRLVAGLALVAAGAIGVGYWWMTTQRSVPSSSRLRPQAAVAAAVLPSDTAAPVTLKDGLPVRLILAEDVPTDAPEGTAIRFEVADDVLVDDRVVIRKGAVAIGAVLDVTKKKILGSARMTFHLERVEAVDGRKVAIRATRVRDRDGLSRRPVDTGDRKSKDVAAAAGARYWGYVDGTAAVSAKK